MTAAPKRNAAGDIWGAVASMLVILPAAVAFGVAIYSPFGPEYVGQGALAGILGAVCIGIIAPFFGGTERMVSGPCAPAAAVMGALAAELIKSGHADPVRALWLMALVALCSSILQIIYGASGGGTLIKYIPFSVVTGYLSSVGVIIFLKQLPGFFGFPKSIPLWSGVTTPSMWNSSALIVGLATICMTLLAPKITKAIPATILGVVGGVLAYFGVSAYRPELRIMADNHLIIGAIQGGGSFADGLERLKNMIHVSGADISLIAAPALTLSVLLSIDTLKTCLLVDSLTRTRHRSNRELMSQGLANMVSALAGGVPGSGTAGPTLVNIASGAQTRWSGVLSGSLVLVALLLLRPYIAWTPLAALAGILIIVGFRMFDRRIFRLLKQKSTVLDFVVIATVIIVSVSVGLIPAVGAGIGLTVFLYLRDQIHSPVTRRKFSGSEISSKQKRLPDELEILQKVGDRTVVCELQGNLFFGTTDRLYQELQADLTTRRFIILDFTRVQSLDFSAAHLLELIEAQLAERGASLVFSGLPAQLHGGQNIQNYLREMGVLHAGGSVKIFDQLSDAVEWVEDCMLEEAKSFRPDETLLELKEMEFLKGRKEDTLRELEECMERRSYKAGDQIFTQGDDDDSLYLILRGNVRVILQAGAVRYHIATFGQGDFFGEMAFLAGGSRSADAVATCPTDLMVLSRKRCDQLSDKHPRMWQHLFADLARILALRLRQADAEIRALQN